MNISRFSARDEFTRSSFEPHAVFYDHPTQDAKLSEERGRPVHRNEVWVKITPRDPDLHVKDSVSRRATDAHKAKFPEAWAAYEAQQKDRLERPVGLLRSVTAEIGADLAALGIGSIEQLARTTPQDVAEFILTTGRYERADPETKQAIKESAARAAQAFESDFATQIKEARYYAAEEIEGSSPAGDPHRRVGENDDGGREEVQSVQGRPALPDFPTFSYSWTA